MAVGIASLVTVAHGSTGALQLIAEAKALNIQVVEGPNKTFGTNVDLQTYYDVANLRTLLFRLNNQSHQWERSKGLSKAQAKYEKDLTPTKPTKEYSTKSNSLRILTSIKSYKRTTKQLAEYQQKNWTLGNNNLRLMRMQAKYKATAQYEKLKQKMLKLRAYEKAKADYEKASTASEDTSRIVNKKEYAKAMWLSG